jgi:hypothetical protein
MREAEDDFRKSEGLSDHEEEKIGISKSSNPSGILVFFIFPEIIPVAHRLDD